MKPLLRAALPAALAAAGAWPAAAQSPFLRAADTRTLTPESVMAQRKSWGLDVSLGGSFARGNVEVNYLAGSFNAFAARGPSTLYLSGSGLYNTFGKATVFSQGSLTTRLDRRLAGPWKAFAFATNAYNEFLRLNYRATLGLGPWYDLSLGRSTHGLSLALAHEYERFRFGRVERGARLSWRSLSKVPLSGAADLGADVFFMPRLDQLEDYRTYLEISLNTLIWKDFLGLKVAWINEYDSRPQAGVKRSDTLWLTSLTVRLGK